MTRPEVYTDGTTEPPVLQEAARWARTMMSQLGAVDPPLFGSAEWVAAPGPVRLASALRAAVAYAHDRDPHVIAARYDIELGAAWRHQERDFQEWKQIAQRVRASAEWPSHEVLQQRRSA